jgi:tyrosinase
MSPFVITGAGGGSPSPNRLEINDFVKNDKFFSLYIQALQAMSTTDQSNIQSFFQVGGIHGLPNIPWDGVTGNPPFNPQSNQWGGYCTHGSVLFPTWHRPYVMLYEQILQNQAQQIAASYTVDTDAWKQAALDLRQPFWDWAANAVPPDQVIAQQQVTITISDGSTSQVDNPWYQYTFNPIDPSFPDPYSGWPTTVRQPDTTDPGATTDVQMLKSVLSSAQPNLTSTTYNLLSRVQTWPAFSNHTVGDGGSASNSLEGIHDGIHVDVGGQGQMADPSVAALDPIFFLHHCNVDRLLSLWSAINPGVWVTPGVAEDEGSFTTPPGAPVDQNTALTPFWNGQQTFWPSAVLKDTTKLGYSYPEFNGLDLGDTNAVKIAISNRVNQLYGAPITADSSFLAVPPSLPAPVSTAKKAPESIPATVSPAKNVPAPAPAHNSGVSSHMRVLPAHVMARDAPAPSPASHSPAQQQQQHHGLTTQVIDDLRNLVPSHLHPHAANVHSSHSASYAPPNRGSWEWTARIEFKKYELGTSFSVLLFLGHVPENPRELRISPNFVGGHHAFVNSAANSCTNCRHQRDLVEEGFVHLNHGIVKLSGLGSLEPDVVVPYLTQNLHWRVQKSNREVVDLESLEVTVIATPLTYPPDAIFPVPGPATRYNGITYGRRGGSRES